MDFLVVLFGILAGIAVIAFIIAIFVNIIRWLLKIDIIVKNQEDITHQLESLNSKADSKDTKEVVRQLQILNSKIKTAKPVAASPEKIRKIKASNATKIK